MRAGLDFVAEGQAVSAEGKPLSYNGSDFDWNLSLAMDLPIDRLPERNAYRASLIALEASTRRAEEAADNIVADLRAALRNLEAARESYEIQQGAVTLAERRRESTELNLEAGRANTRDVLESQEDLVDAQNSAARDLTTLLTTTLLLAAPLLALALLALLALLTLLTLLTRLALLTLLTALLIGRLLAALLDPLLAGLQRAHQVPGAVQRLLGPAAPRIAHRPGGLGQAPLETPDAPAAPLLEPPGLLRRPRPPRPPRSRRCRGAQYGCFE